MPKEVEITNLRTGEKERVLTMIMGEGQYYDRKVDGQHFNPYLMAREKTLEVARLARRLYDERKGIKAEGTTSRQAKEY